MKKSIVAVLAIGLILSFSTMAMAGMAAGSGIKASFHDLSSLGASVGMGDSVEQVAGPNSDRICIYCHAPHNTRPVPDATFTYLPLWNHAVTTNALFQNYSNGSDNALFDQSNPLQAQHSSTAMIISGQPGSVSLLCLSCHDGSVAANEYGYAPSQSVTRGAPATIDATNRASIGNGGNLSNHHPIGFDYASVAGFDPEIAPLATVLVGAKAGGPTTVQDLLWAGNTMECSSCHDVHNTQNAGAKFTWIDDAQSALCLTCHLKG